MGAHLDAAAGVPLHPAARAALAAAADDGWADPGRLYGSARRARILLDAAREATAEALGARPDEVDFAPNGTAALHAAVLGALRGRAGTGSTFVHSAVEHSAVLQAAALHEDAGGRVVSVGVDAHGRVDPQRFTRTVREAGAVAAALQVANHEVGTLQPVDELGLGSDVALVVDATQAVGRIPLPRDWSVLAADARTWGAPSIGVMAVRTGTRWRSPYPSDDRGRLPGVVDLPSAVAAAAALRAVIAEREAEHARQFALVERIRREVTARVPDVEVLGDPERRLPHIVTFSCLYVDGEALLTVLDRHGFAVSSGSSCTSSRLEPSHVLVAMGALTSGNVRVSLHAGVDDDDVTRFLDLLPSAVAEVRAELGADGL